MAQRNPATMPGTVKDSSGAVVPKATVTAKHLSSAAVRTMTTAASGDYVMADMDVGHYRCQSQRANDPPPRAGYIQPYRPVLLWGRIGQYECGGQPTTMPFR